MRKGSYQSKKELRSISHGPNNERQIARICSNISDWLGDPKQNIEQMLERIEGENNAIEGEFTREAQ